MRSAQLGDRDTLTADKLALQVAAHGFGAAIVVDHSGLTKLPAVHLSATFKWCSDKFRADMDAWLLERFGRKDHVFFLGNHTVVMSAENAARLKAAGVDALRN
jgi:hypothetical protein